MERSTKRVSTSSSCMSTATSTPRATLADIPNDVIVSIFHLTE